MADNVDGSDVAAGDRLPFGTTLAAYTVRFFHHRSDRPLYI
jgi:hypothetical protein